MGNVGAAGRSDGFFEKALRQSPSSAGSVSMMCGAPSPSQRSMYSASGDCGEVQEVGIGGLTLEARSGKATSLRISLDDDGTSSPLTGATGDAPKTLPARAYRLRFFNFNMANNSSFASLSELQGPGGRGFFEDTLRAPMADGHPVDVVFATLVETRLNVTEWVHGYEVYNRACGEKKTLDRLLQQNARREGAQNTRSTIRTFMESLAATYNGNLKSLIAFGSDTFEEVQEAVLFGRLTEAKVGRIPVPNPKKAFMGRTLVDHAEGLRLCFVGAHFPIAKLAAALEDPLCDPLHNAKIALARTLRKVLRKAARRNLADSNTVFFVQGDLNSRTVLGGKDGKAYDALLELLNDDLMQEAIQQQLSLPPGRFYEIPRHDSMENLPVTYKFSETVGHVDGVAATLALGDVLSVAAMSSNGLEEDAGDSLGRNASSPANVAKARPNSPQDEWQRTATPSSNSRLADAGRQTSGTDLYRRTLSRLGDQQLAKWGLAFKKGEFRAFRFPASADRVIYWAPNTLAERILWEFPRGGYEVNHAQLGSDHRPVALEAVMRLSESPVAPERSAAATRVSTTAMHTPKSTITLEDSDAGEWSDPEMNGMCGAIDSESPPPTPQETPTRLPLSSSLSLMRAPIAL